MAQVGNAVDAGKLAGMWRGLGGGKVVRIAGWLLALAALALILAQAILPGIAARRISQLVGRYGHVGSVSVSAWPALKLLWGSADSVRLRAGALSLTPAQTAQLVSEAAGAARIDATAASVQEGPLHLSEARLRKRGGRLVGEGRMTPADVSAALPPGVRVELLGSEAGQVTVRVSGGLFGARAGVEAMAEASAGQLVARPLRASLGSLRLTLFSDPRIRVDGVAAVLDPGPPAGYRLTMQASLR